jgi:hypothetical protein
VALELFEVLERKLEQVLGQYQTLQNEDVGGAGKGLGRDPGSSW